MRSGPKCYPGARQQLDMGPLSLPSFLLGFVSQRLQGCILHLGTSTHSDKVPALKSPLSASTGSKPSTASCETQSKFQSILCPMGPPPWASPQPPHLWYSQPSPTRPLTAQSRLQPQGHRPCCSLCQGHPSLRFFHTCPLTFFGPLSHISARSFLHSILLLGKQLNFQFSARMLVTSIGDHPVSLPLTPPHTPSALPHPPPVFEAQPL